MIDVPLTTTTLLTAVPQPHVAPAKKPVPVIVTPVPPLADPDAGTIPLTVDAELDEPLGGHSSLVPVFPGC